MTDLNPAAYERIAALTIPEHSGDWDVFWATADAGAGTLKRAVERAA